MKDSNTKREKVFILKFTEKEIAIIKAGLEYFRLDDEFGYVLWGSIPGATFGGRDWEYRYWNCEIYNKLEQASDVKPDFGWWGNIDRLFKLADKKLNEAKWQGDKEWEEITFLSEYQNKITCPECGKENLPSETSFDYNKPRYKGWFYLKCGNGHTINQPPYTLLVNNSEAKELLSKTRKKLNKYK